MASLLFSISFLMPLSVPKFSFKELQSRKSAVSRLSGQPTSGTATNLLVICNATGELLSVNQSCGGCPTTPTTHFYELVSSCMHMIVEKWSQRAERSSLVVMKLLAADLLESPRRSPAGGHARVLQEPYCGGRLTPLAGKLINP